MGHWLMYNLRYYIGLTEALTTGLPTKIGRNYIIVGSDHRGNAGQPPPGQPQSGQQFQFPPNMPRTLWVEKGEQALGKGIAAQIGFQPLKTIIWDTSIMGPQEILKQDFILKDFMIAPDPKMTLLAALMAQQQVWLSPKAARPQPEILKKIAGQAARVLDQPNLPETIAVFNRVKNTSGVVTHVQKELNSIKVESLVSKLIQGGMFIVGIELWPQVEAAI